VRPARVSTPGGVVRHSADQTCIRATVAVRKATSDSTSHCIKQNASSVREKDKVAADGKGVRDVIPTPDLRIGTGSARSETRPDRGRLPLMAVGPLSCSAI
jgi:phenylalanyl-tRNA synthetase beta subunit